jgi:hypothetical protein
MFSLLASFALDVAAIHACSIPPVCVETGIQAGESAGASNKACADRGGSPMPSCPHTAGESVCQFGDTTMRGNLTGLGGDQREGTVRALQRKCHSVGGRFELAGKLVTQPAGKQTHALSLATAKGTLVGLADCEAEGQLGSDTVTCGGMNRAEVTLTVAAYRPGEGFLADPKDPDAALATLVADSGSAKVTELARTPKDKARGTWRLSYRVAGAHGLPAFGFREVRTWNKDLLQCQGTAWSEADLAEAGRMCTDLRAR